MPETARRRVPALARGGMGALVPFGVAVAAGALAGLGQLPFGLPYVTLAVLAAVLALVLRHALPERKGMAFGLGWAFGFGHFLLTLHWITQPFLVEAEVFGWLAPFGLVAMASGLALFWGLAALVARLVGHGRPGPTALALIAGFGLSELLRAHVLTGFPWALIGHVWIGAGLDQSARIWGAHGLGLVTSLAALVMATGLLAPHRAVGWAMILGAPAALLAAGLILDPGPASEPGPGAPVVRLVQPNVAQADKTNPEAIPVYTRRLVDLTAEAMAGGGRPDLVVWPETALPWLLDYMPDVLPVISEAAQGAPLVFGVQRNEGERFFNTLVQLDPDGGITGLYDKHHLVPFGEYVPLGEIAARFGIEGIAASDGGGYTPGPGPTVMDIPGIGTAVPLICYEGIFPEEIGRALNAGADRPRFLMLITNDAWFGTFAGPYQHFALSRLRSIETGLPMIRAANTGISAVIDARGRVIASLGLEETGFVDAALPPALATTPYSRFGDWPVVLILGFGLLAAGVGARRYRIDPAAPRG